MSIQIATLFWAMVFSFGFSFILTLLTAAQPAHGKRTERGTITVIRTEPSAFSSTELPLPFKPEAYQPPLNERIFNEKLTKEFNERYRQQFGIEQNYRQPSRVILANTDGVYLAEAEEEENRRQAFAGYMVRRLTEYHLDNYAKNDPQIRPAYELKERISQVEIEVVRGYKVEGKYSISENLFELKLGNPYVDSKAVMEFGSEGPSQRPEVTYSVAKDVTKRVVIATYFRTIKDQVSLVGTRELEPGLSVSLTGSSVGRRERSLNGEKLILAGLVWNY